MKTITGKHQETKNKLSLCVATQEDFYLTKFEFCSPSTKCIDEAAVTNYNLKTFTSMFKIIYVGSMTKPSPGYPSW